MNKLHNGWTEYKLKDLCVINYGKGLGKSNIVNGNIPVYSSGGIIGFHNTYNVNSEGVIIGRKGNAGSVFYSDKPFFCIDTAFYIEPNNQYDLKYLFYKLVSMNLKNHKTGTAIPGLIRNDIYKLSISIPPLDEQKRIASALSKIDAYLENTIKLIEEKERFKRGIAKKLLTCKEGENIPEARFKGFEDEWEIVKLGDICLINNKSLKENTDKNYKFKYIDLTAVKKGIINFSNDYTNFENAPISARRIINKNDIIMATVRPYLLGHAFIDFEAKDYICSKGFAVLTANSNIEMKYIYQYLYSDDMAKQIKSRLVGSTYPTIRLSDIKELKIKIPKSIKEQEKIGGYLSLLDKEIDNLKK